MMKTYLFILKMAAGILVFLGAFAAAMIFGAADTTLNDVWLAMTGAELSDKATMIREIRLPREVAAMAVGAALAVSGAIMQGLTRNPLADPGLIGLTAGGTAALAITLAFIPGVNYFGIMIACFIGCAVGAAMVLGIGSMQKGGFSPMRIVLAGAAVSAFLFAVSEGVGITFKLSKDVSMWTSGGMAGTSWSQLQFIIPFIAGGILISLMLSRQLTILSLSEEVAVGLGQKTVAIKGILFVVIVLLAGAGVALAGNLAFVGLMVPHIVRAIVGTDYRYIIPMSVIMGASFMLLADTVGRTVNAPYETPVAAVVAVLGLPFFLFIVRKGGRHFT